MRVVVLVLACIVCLPLSALPQDVIDEREIAEAVSALPQAQRDGATVRAFRGGALVTLREGSNGLVCLGDDPARDGWHVACYHESLDAFMARGRELRAAGVTNRAAIESRRLAEIESGELDFPDGPAALYSLSGEEGSFDPVTGEAEGVRGLTVIYLPYATEASTGISMEGSRDRPWLMAPGKPWAHVMISR
jgi:hypothetical protein